MTTDLRQLGEAIRAARMKKGMTQEALAEKLARREPDCRPSIGVDRSHVL